MSQEKIRAFALGLNDFNPVAKRETYCRTLQKRSRFCRDSLQRAQRCWLKNAAIYFCYSELLALACIVQNTNPRTLIAKKRINEVREMIVILFSIGFAGAALAIKAYEKIQARRRIKRRLRQIE